MSKKRTDATRGANLAHDLSDQQCWKYVFAAFGGEARTPPAVDRHQVLAEAVRKAYRDGRAAAVATRSAGQAVGGAMRVEPCYIRATHPYAFRSDEWAEVAGVNLVNKRPCWLVLFSDGRTDLWPVEDRVAGYEFSSKP